MVVTFCPANEGVLARGQVHSLMLLAVAVAHACLCPGPPVSCAELRRRNLPSLDRLDRLDSATPRRKAVDETFAELDCVSARWMKRSLREELLDELTLFK